MFIIWYFKTQYSNYIYSMYSTTVINILNDELVIHKRELPKISMFNLYRDEERFFTKKHVVLEQDMYN